MIVVNTPFHFARSRRDTVGMCDALLDVIASARREAIVGAPTADSGPIDTRQARRGPVRVGMRVVEQ